LQYFELSFPLNHDAKSFSQKSQKQHLVMLLPIMGSEQHKVKKKMKMALFLSIKTFIKNNKGTLFSLNTIVFTFLSHFSLMFIVD